MDTCSSSNTTFPLCTFNKSYKRAVQRRGENQTILLKVIVNDSNFQNIPCIFQSSWREQQSHPKQTECESKRDVNVDHQGSGAIAKKSKPLRINLGQYKSLDSATPKKDLKWSQKWTTAHEVSHFLKFWSICILGFNFGGRNPADEQLNHSCLLAMMEDQNDCINISLQLKSFMEYPMCMTKITWLTMIPVVFVFTVSIVIYKIVQANKQNYYKHRVATSVSTVLRRKGSRRARTISATKIHPFPGK
ncbi:TM156 protein, partial [Sylvietta virens]|nr:TM156 protein [Sylvietta virens]